MRTYLISRSIFHWIIHLGKCFFLLLFFNINMISAITYVLFVFISSILACYFENKSRPRNRIQQNHQESSNITITQVYPLLLRSYLFLLRYVRLFFCEISTLWSHISNFENTLSLPFKIENKTIVSIKYEELIYIYFKKYFYKYFYKTDYRNVKIYISYENSYKIFCLKISGI